MNDGSCNEAGRFGIKKRTDATKLTNVRIARFKQCRDLIRESEVFIKYKAKVTSGVSRDLVLREDLFILANCCLSPMRRNSVLEELRVSKLESCSTVLCNCVVLYK